MPPAGIAPLFRNEREAGVDPQTGAGAAREVRAEPLPLREGVEYDVVAQRGDPVDLVVAEARRGDRERLLRPQRLARQPRLEERAGGEPVDVIAHPAEDLAVRQR